MKMFLFCFFYLPDSVGTIDRYLYPYYVHDIDAGLLSREQAGELIAEFYEILGDNKNSDNWKNKYIEKKDIVNKVIEIENELKNGNYDGIIDELGMS